MRPLCFFSLLYFPAIPIQTDYAQNYAHNFNEIIVKPKLRFKVVISKSSSVVYLKFNAHCIGAREMFPISPNSLKLLPSGMALVCAQTG